ncbi:minor capsid protein [Ectothiorhodospira shaposhnikovii]|uniref:minor capsid protein n=1 Tax=Ectothiorhodospira shaposhnikovii TaxID=1054 RepID=UPI001EE8EA94|nr:minor capsid protein [Ectothiorhodospira shaposhnikovii]MCG5512858.1 minor capsid protein [Ectothiorhodospira shaposhnikovii]
MSKYLEAQGVGVVGRDIFVRNMPYTVRRGILITEPLTGTMIDPELPDYYKTRINLIVRSQTYEDGLALAETLVDRLKLNETRMQGVLVKYMHPRHLPVPYPISDGENLEISVSFDVVFVKD